MDYGITSAEPNGVEEVAIDIDESVVAMQRGLRENTERIGGTSYKGERIQIHRVPQSLIGIHPTAIQSELVSIGPYHHRTDELLEFESYKWWFLNKLLSRTARHDVRDLVEAAKKLEDTTRKYYNEDIPVSSSDFVEMMVLDGCFIIELFRHVCRNEDVIGTDYDPILSKPWLIPILTRDLLKLENQLPFLVLQTLFDLTVSANAVGDPLALLALKFFNLSFPRPSDGVLKRASHSFSRCHLLALFHSSFRVNMYYNESRYCGSQYGLVPGISPLLAFPQLPPPPEQSLLLY